MSTFEELRSPERRSTAALEVYDAQIREPVPAAGSRTARVCMLLA